MKWYQEIPKEEAPKQVKVKVEPETEVKVSEKCDSEILTRAILDKTPPMRTEDNVNHPSHYTQGGIECIEAIKASMTASEFRGYLKGNAMKYMWRYQLKNGVEDLRKAQWYLNRLIKEMTR